MSVPKTAYVTPGTAPDELSRNVGSRQNLSIVRDNLQRMIVAFPNVPDGGMARNRSNTFKTQSVSLWQPCCVRRSNSSSEHIQFPVWITNPPLAVGFQWQVFGTRTQLTLRAGRLVPRDVAKGKRSKMPGKTAHRSRRLGALTFNKGKSSRVSRKTER